MSGDDDCQSLFCLPLGRQYLIYRLRKRGQTMTLKAPSSRTPLSVLPFSFLM